MAFNVNEAKKMLEEYYMRFIDGTTKNSDEEIEKDNFTAEEFDKACKDLGLEDSGEETDDVDDFFSRLNTI